MASAGRPPQERALDAGSPPFHKGPLVMSRTLPALLLLPVVVCATGCPPRPAPAPPPGEGVSPRSLEARLHGAAGERIAARPGDALLRNAHLSAVVAAVPLPLGFSRTLGALVDLVPAGAETDSLQGLSPRVRVAGKTLAVEALEVRQDEDGVVVTGRLPGHPYLDVRTTFRLPRDGSCLEVATAVTNRGHEPRVVGVEDDLYVGNVRWFVPGLGLVEGAASVEAPWLAQAGRGLAFAYGPATPGPLALELRALDIGDHRFFGAVRPFLGLAEVAPSRSVTWRRLVTAARGDVADAADLLHRALSAKGRRITGRVRAAGGGAPGPGTLVVARDEQGRPISRARVDADGLLSLHLPPGRVELVAIAPGLPASEPVTVEEGAEDDPVLTLPPAGRLRFSVRGGKGRPLPARLVLSGVHPTPDPDLGPVTHARGARNMV